VHSKLQQFVVIYFYESTASQIQEGMEVNCTGSQGPQRIVVVEGEEEEEGEDEEGEEQENGTTFNTWRSAKFCRL
jgi:hypothetical protein